MWYHVSVVPVDIPAGVGAVADLMPALILPPALQGGYTAKRLIGRFQFGSTAIGPGNDINGGIGIYAGTRSSLAAPPNAVLDFVDWWWNHPFSFQVGFTGDKYSVDIDLRSGRKVRGEDRTIGISIDNSILSQTIRVYFSARMWLSRS